MSRLPCQVQGAKETSGRRAAHVGVRSAGEREQGGIDRAIPRPRGTPDEFPVLLGLLLLMLLGLGVVGIVARLPSRVHGRTRSG